MGYDWKGGLYDEATGTGPAGLTAGCGVGEEGVFEFVSLYFTAVEMKHQSHFVRMLAAHQRHYIGGTTNGIS